MFIFKFKEVTKNNSNQAQLFQTDKKHEGIVKQWHIYTFKVFFP